MDIFLLLHALVVLIYIHCLIQEKAPHSVAITVLLFDIAHQLVPWSPGRIVNAHLLILQAECLFESREILDVRNCLAFARHIMTCPAHQEHIHITLITDRGSRHLGISLCWAPWWAQHPRKSLAEDFIGGFAVVEAVGLALESESDSGWGLAHFVRADAVAGGSLSLSITSISSFITVSLVSGVLVVGCFGGVRQFVVGCSSGGCHSTELMALSIKADFVFIGCGVLGCFALGLFLFAKF